MSDMTPDEARDDLEHLDDFEVGDVYDTARRALATLAGMTTLYRAEMYYERNGTTEWRPFPSDAGEWRRSKNLAEMSVSVAKRDNPDVRSAMRVARCYITGSQEVTDE